MISGKKVIGIVGSRKRNSDADRFLVEEYVTNLVNCYVDPNIELIFCSGGCWDGADAFIKQLCRDMSLNYLEFPAGWGRHGKAAGYIRNAYIAEASDVLVALVVPESEALGGSYKGGTEDTIRKFKKSRPDWEANKLLILL